MFKLLTKDVNFYWDSFYQNDFDTLKEKPCIAPVLRGPNWSIPFHISTDASDTALGAVLGHKDNQITHAIYFIS